MEQPILGKILTAVRKEKNLTQEALAELSLVSVRTIQRVENGEVVPRMSTVKILLEALNESHESFLLRCNSASEPNLINRSPFRPSTLLIAALSGAVYLVTEIILGAMDVIRFTSRDSWQVWTNTIYIVFSVLMMIAFVLFIRGFISLAKLFENTLLNLISYVLIASSAALAILNVVSLFVDHTEFLWASYVVAFMILGSTGIAFGVALLRLQDGMGEFSRIAGILEIVMGCVLVTVVLFFLTYVILIPTVVVEILLLYRGYEYLSKSQAGK